MSQSSSLLRNAAELYAPDLPWNTYVPGELGQVIMQHVDDHEPFFRWWAQIWYENFQFLFGNHNIRWSRRHGFAVDHDFLRQGSAFGLKSQTNIARVVVEALASLIYSNLPEWEVETMDESSLKGKRFRKIYQKLLDCYMRRLSMDQEFAIAAVNYVLFGQTAWKVDWNPSMGKLIEIPRWKKTKAPSFSTYMAPNQATGGLLEVPTPLTDERGQPIMEDRWEAEVDEVGRQIVERVLAGDVGVRTMTPLEYRRQVGSPGFHKTRWAQDFQLYDYDEFMDKFKNVEGQTKAFRKIRPLSANPMAYNFAVRHFMRMQFTTPPSGEDGMRRMQSVFKGSMFKHKVFVVEHYDEPNAEKGWENGRRVIVCNGDATHVTKPNYCVEGTQDGWHPYAEAQWLVAAPSSIAIGPMNDVVRKNRELNVKDSLVATAVRRNMGSQLLIKTGSGIDPQRLTGEPGMTHEVSDPYGARWLHDDLPIPTVMSSLRQADKDDVYEVSGAGDALRGSPSTGASSGYQEKQREEREEKRLAPARKNFERGVGTVGEKVAACLKSNVIRLDTLTMGYLKRAAAGEYTTQDVVAFLSTPVAFGTDIKVKKASMSLRSKASQQALLQELAGGALGQRLGQDAKVLDKYLKYFDAETFRDASSAHRDRAERENEAFQDMLRLGPDLEGLSRPKVLFDDDDDIHIAEHTEYFIQNSEEMMGSEWMLLQYLTHVEHHRLQKQEKEAALMPGTALQTGPMMAQARQTATPTVQTIYQKTIMDQQQKQMQAQQQQAQGGPGGPPKPGMPGGQQPPARGGPASLGQRQAPQAPRPGGRTDPQAPSGNTPTAASRGGF